MHNRRLIFIVNHAAFFVSHRLPIAIEARQVGYEVVLITGQAGSAEMEQSAVTRLEAEGFEHRRVAFRSASINPVVELIGLCQLIWNILKLRPALIHCASPKGVLYGGIAARLCRVRGLVLAISGLGYAYTVDEASKGLRSAIRYVYSGLANFAFRHPNRKVIVQNPDDYRLVIEQQLASASQLIVVPGSGVDLTLFDSCTLDQKQKIVLLPARMLKDKGVIEFAEAARAVKDKAPEWRFVLAGAADYDNPSAVTADQLRSWEAEGVIEWLGHIDDMIPLYRTAAIVCLPSYREGMPKALLEAAAAHCAVVTTDVTGCRSAIENGVTGDLVPARDSDALARALEALMRDDARVTRYAIKGHERAEALFSIDAVVMTCLNIYRELSDAS